MSALERLGRVLGFLLGLGLVGLVLVLLIVVLLRSLLWLASGLHL